MATPETDTTPLDPYTFGRDQTCYGCGPHNPVGLQMRFERVDDTVQTRLTLGRGYDGPPGILHGGMQAMICDELAGWTLIGLRGRIGLTTSMNLRYMRSLRLDREVLGVGRLVSEGESGIATVRVSLEQDGKTGCVARVAFRMADGDRMEEILEGPLPEGWRPFFDGPGES